MSHGPYVQVRISIPARLLVAGHARAAARALPWGSYLATLVWTDLGRPGAPPTHPNWARAPRPLSATAKVAVAADRCVKLLTTFPAELWEAGKAHAQGQRLSWSGYLAQLVRADLDTAPEVAAQENRPTPRKKH